MSTENFTPTGDGQHTEQTTADRVVSELRDNPDAVLRIAEPGTEKFDLYYYDQENNVFRVAHPGSSVNTLDETDVREKLDEHSRHFLAVTAEQYLRDRLREQLSDARFLASLDL